jgi:hypothetical protein
MMAQAKLGEGRDFFLVEQPSWAFATHAGWVITDWRRGACWVANFDIELDRIPISEEYQNTRWWFLDSAHPDVIGVFAGLTMLGYERMAPMRLLRYPGGASMSAAFGDHFLPIVAPVTLHIPEAITREAKLLRKLLGASPLDGVTAPLPNGPVLAILDGPIPYTTQFLKDDDG